MRLIARGKLELGATFPSVFDIDNWDLDNVEVRREWRNIDILLLDFEHHFLVVIENKVYSAQHDEQLRRYKAIVESEFPGFQKTFVYLFVREDEPEDSDYLPITYSEIAPLIQQVIDTKRSILNSEIVTFISHYHSMLRRHIMEDSILQEICHQIYRRHRHALELIFDTVPIRDSRIQGLLAQVIQGDQELLPDDSTKDGVRFIPVELDWIPKSAQNSTSTNRILLFYIGPGNQELLLSVYLSPGDANLRKAIYDAAQNNKALFNKAHRKLTPMWFTLHKTTFLPVEDIDEVEDNVAITIIKSRLDGFKTSLFQGIAKQLSQLKDSFPR